MNPQPLRVLLVEDSESDAGLIKNMLAEQQNHLCKVDHVVRLSQALERLSRGDVDVVLLDLHLPDSRGVDTLAQARSSHPATPFVVITGLEDELAGVEALRRGAQDYLLKGEFDGPALSRSLRFAIERERMARREGGGSDADSPSAPADEHALSPRSAPRHMRESPSRAKWRKSTDGIVYASETMKRVLDTVDRVARENVPVLIYGETGTGKELIASAIHHNTMNPRKDKPFISINCASLTESLLESELFGHMRGAFTGAVTTKQGILEAIDGGTLFLDEIPEASPCVQAKLLRVLDSGDFIKLGDTSPRRVDVRIIAATNKNLPEEISARRFREDLFQRLNAVTIYVPPLRDRPDDIPALIDFFLEQFNRNFGKTVSMNDEVRRVLTDTRWIGNVRELKHLIQNLCIMAERTDKVVTSDDLMEYAGQARPESVRGRMPLSKVSGGMADAGRKTLADVRTNALRSAQKDYIMRLLKENRGNVTASAKGANVSRRYMTQLLKEFHIQSKRFKS